MTYEPHHPVKYKSIPWPVCRYCGLVYLRNKLTKWCIDNGCNHKDHPNYKQIVLKLSSME